METKIMKRCQLEHAVCSEKIVMSKCSAFGQYFPRMVGAFRTHEHLFLVSEFIPGGSLDMLLYEHEQRRLLNTGQTAVGKDREFPLAAIRVIFKEICAAVNCLHEHHIIHNQIHPENILITHNGHIKLCDFSSVMCTSDTIDAQTDAPHAADWLATVGKAKQQSSCDTDAISDSRWSSSDMGSMDSTRSGFYSEEGDNREQKTRPLRSIVVNSSNANYIAPEVHMYNRYSTASDWWAAGVILYRMIFGSLPFGDIRERDEIIRERVIALDMDTHGFDLPCCSTVALHMIKGFLQNSTVRMATGGEILGHPFLDKVDLTSAYLHKGPINTRPSFDDPLACFTAATHVPNDGDVQETKMNISLAMKNNSSTFEPDFSVFPTA
jgi:serine/threonine protein kinase